MKKNVCFEVFANLPENGDKLSFSELYNVINTNREKTLSNSTLSKCLKSLVISGRVESTEFSAKNLTVGFWDSVNEKWIGRDSSPMDIQNYANQIGRVRYGRTKPGPVKEDYLDHPLLSASAFMDKPETIVELNKQLRVAYCYILRNLISFYSVSSQDEKKTHDKIKTDYNTFLKVIIEPALYDMLTISMSYGEIDARDGEWLIKNIMNPHYQDDLNKSFRQVHEIE